MNKNNFKMENLRKLREKKHITQIKLSVDLEISQELVSQYELGKSMPTPVNLIKIANYFNCSVDYLLGRTNDPKPIENIGEKEIELNDIIEKYTSLSAENKKHLASYLNHLVNENK